MRDLQEKYLWLAGRPWKQNPEKDTKGHRSRPRIQKTLFSKKKSKTKEAVRQGKNPRGECSSENEMQSAAL